jgi:multidrug efflux system outer membrane protein
MGPDYTRPELDIGIRDAYQHADSMASPVCVKEAWWEEFGNQRLNQVVHEVLRHNYDLMKARAVIVEFRARLVQSRAERFPVVTIQGGFERYSTPGETISSTFETGGITQSYNLSVPASFELDLWGRLTRLEQAADSELLSAVENRHALTQSLVGEAISLYLQIEAIERRIQIAELSVQNFRWNLDLVERRYERGLVSLLDVRQARRILFKAETRLPQLHQELGTSQQRLALLLGRYPETFSPKQHPVDYFVTLPPVPPGIPSNILVRRPDVRAAEASLEALNARVGAARASRFPSITLTGTFGYSSEELGQLLRPESELWSLASGVFQPLFDAGKLKAEEQAAAARYQQGVAEYASTILTAFAEVEKTLLTRKRQLERRERTLYLVAEARAAQELAEARYARGLVDYLSVLDAQQARFAAEEELVLIELTILSNRASLYRALGGTWLEPSVEGISPEQASLHIQEEAGVH